MVKTTGIIMIDPLGKPFCDLTKCKNSPEVEAFLNAGVGKEVDIVIAAQAEKLLAYTEADRIAQAKKIEEHSWEKPIQIEMSTIPQTHKPTKAKRGDKK